VQALPADQQKAWADAMQAKLEQYKAESGRIQNEQGDVTADILRVLDPKAAADVAIQRMTTRPWVITIMPRKGIPISSEASTAKSRNARGKWIPNPAPSRCGRR
jgi:hypothetical protein